MKLEKKMMNSERNHLFFRSFESGKRVKLIVRNPFIRESRREKDLPKISSFCETFLDAMGSRQLATPMMTQEREKTFHFLCAFLYKVPFFKSTKRLDNF